MPFVGEIFSQLKASADTVVLQEIRDGQVTGVTGAEFLELVRKARTFCSANGLKKGDRFGLLAANSIRWMAVDLAAMAEGLIVVPLYFRQASVELVAMMKDSAPSLVCCGDATLRDGIRQNWPGAPPQFLLDEVFAGTEGAGLDRPQVRDEDPVTIIYTSGTSGEAKGVVLTASNVGFMLGCTSTRLDSLMEGRSGQDRIFHYLPFSFCASWIAMLTFLLRGSLVTLNTDLTKIPNDMPAVAPHYFLNVPQ
jgi:long-subunit acyl-CoA synthetase (AMP-forming)